MKLALSLAVCVLGLVSHFLVIPEASAQVQPSVSSVTLHRDDDRQERIRIKLVGTHAPQVFDYKGDNPRLICDFPGAGYAGLVKPVVSGAGALVRDIRVGAHTSPEKKVRVVLDLEPGRKYTYSREFNKEENILNLVLVTTEETKKAETAVARIDATASKLLVITGPGKVKYPLAEPQKSGAAATVAADSRTPPAPKGEGPAPKAAAPAAAPTTPVPAAAEADPGKPAVGKAEPTATGAADRKDLPAPAVAKTDNPAGGVVAVPTPAPPKAEPAKSEPARAVPPKAAATKAEPAQAEPPKATPPEGAPAKAAPAKTEPAKVVPAKTEPAKTAPAKVVATPGKAGAAPAPLLQEISYENSSSKGEMIFFRLNGFYPPTVSAVESDQPQVVCDFVGMERQEGIAPVIEARGAYVRKIVTTVDREPKRIKVVLELTAGRDYDLRQVFFKEDNLFVLIVNALDEERAATTAEPGAR